MKVAKDMESCIYRGSVMHRRYTPVANAFRYSLFMMYLDLDELPTLFAPYRCWSYEAANLASWRRQDYLGPRDLPLADAVRYRIKEQTGLDHTGPIRMLAHARYFGLCYNPVVFYYCFDSSGQSVEAIVAEITNTPWGERHAYILTESMNLGTATRKHYQFPKSFHVSPFMEMDYLYDWRFTAPDDHLVINMRNIRDEQRVFDATLTLDRYPINSRTLASVLLSHPCMTARVVGLIHWQALKLWAKRAPFYKHPARRPDEEKDPYESQDTAARHHDNQSTE